MFSIGNQIGCNIVSVKLTGDYGTLHNSCKNKATLKEDIWEAVSWWKFKNQWKRPIEKDDAKAFRMIKSRVLKD